MSRMYYEQDVYEQDVYEEDVYEQDVLWAGCLKKDLTDGCFRTAFNAFFIGFCRAFLSFFGNEAICDIIHYTVTTLSGLTVSIVAMLPT